MTETAHPTTLLTGATGFLGHMLLRDLLGTGRRVVLLLRPPLHESLTRLRGLMSHVGVDLDAAMTEGRILAIEGGLPGELPAADWGRTDEIVHCAASLQLFLNGTRDPFETNVDGSLALLDWAARRDVPTLHLVSTAYVCGMNTGLIREALHDPRPEFQTDYEHSKWQAERLFADWAERRGASLTIWRPSFVVGDSQTGYTTQYFGFYQLARLVGMLRRQNGEPRSDDDTYVPLRIPLQPEGRHNVVSVDFASRMIAEGVADPAWHGRIYHVTDPDPPINDFWKRCFEEFFHLHGGYFVDPREVNGARSPEEAMLWEQLDVLVPRLHHTPQFDQTNARALMAARELPFPSLNRERVLRLLEYAVRTGWGKRNGVRSLVH